MSNIHIVPHDHKVSKSTRNQQKAHRSVMVWFTGLSGSGKSTLADLVEQTLVNKGIHTYLLDGDNIRMGLNKGLGFSKPDRQENIRRIGEVGKLMVDAGLVTLAAFVSPFKEDRNRVRSLFAEGDFIEIFVDCPLQVCEQRDTKGLYAKARKGEIPQFTGIDSPFEPPEAPEIRVATHRQEIQTCLQEILSVLLPKLQPL